MNSDLQCMGMRASAEQIHKLEGALPCKVTKVCMLA